MHYWRNQGDVNFSGSTTMSKTAQLNLPLSCRLTRTFPELYIAGNSPAAQHLSMTQGSCWMQLPDTPERVLAVTQVLQKAKR